MRSGAEERARRVPRFEYATGKMNGTNFWVAKHAGRGRHRRAKVSAKVDTRDKSSRVCIRSRL